MVSTNDDPTADEVDRGEFARRQDSAQTNQAYEPAQGHQAQDSAQTNQAQEPAQGHRAQEQAQEPAQGHRAQDSAQTNRAQEPAQGTRDRSGGEPSEAAKKSRARAPRFRADQFVSVRVDSDVLDDLRSIAATRNVTLSVVLREAAAEYAAKHRPFKRAAPPGGGVRHGQR